MKPITLLAVLFLLSTTVKTIAQTVYVQVKGKEIELSKDTSDARLFFSGKYHSGKVYLHWIVQNQKEDGIYIIYRSSDSVNYEAIGTKTGVGVPVPVKIAYYFTDDNTVHKDTYYKVLHISRNNTFIFSDKVVVSTQNNLFTKTEQ